MYTCITTNICSGNEYSKHIKNEYMNNKTQRRFLTIFPELSPKAASLIYNIIILFFQ
jgi:hypothetical protein